MPLFLRFCLRDHAAVALGSQVDRLVAGFAASPVAAADAEALARLTLDGAMAAAQG